MKSDNKPPINQLSLRTVFPYMPPYIVWTQWEEDQIRLLNQMIDNLEGKFIVAMDDCYPVGKAFINYRMTDRSRVSKWSNKQVVDGAYVSGLFVDEKYRRQGIATYIMKNLFLEAFISHDCPCMSLHVQQGNDAACALYQSLGFEQRTSDDLYIEFIRYANTTVG